MEVLGREVTVRRLRAAAASAREGAGA